MRDLAIIVPATTNRRVWTEIEETDLYNIFLESLSTEGATPEFNITLYIGYDDDDKIYSILENQLKFNALFHKVSFKWIPFDKIYKGNPVAIWNELGKLAIDDNQKWLYVCGSDIQFNSDNGWAGLFINKLKKTQCIGWSAPWSNNDDIPTQFMVHRTHYDIFGFVYPTEIKNWGCDNFMSEVYPDKFRNWCREVHHLNLGGDPRYDVEFSEPFVKALVKRYRPRLNKYLNLEKKLEEML